MRYGPRHYLGFFNSYLLYLMNRNRLKFHTQFTRKLDLIDKTNTWMKISCSISHETFSILFKTINPSIFPHVSFKTLNLKLGRKFGRR